MHEPCLAAPAEMVGPVSGDSYCLSSCRPVSRDLGWQHSGSNQHGMSNPSRAAGPSHNYVLLLLQALRSQGKPPLAQAAADGARSSGGEGSDTQYTLLPGYISRPNASPYKRRRIQGPSGAHPHYEICMYYQSTSKVQDEVLWNLVVLQPVCGLNRMPSRPACPAWL